MKNILFIFLILYIPSGVLQAGSFVEAQKSDYVIVRPDMEAPIIYPEGTNIVYAAQFLNEYLQKCAGVQLPLVAESKAGDYTRRIFLGPTRHAVQHVGDLKQLQPEEFVIQSDGKDIIICGEISEQNIDRGTLFGVYEFLEKVAGVRWYFADDQRQRYPADLGVITPKQQSIQIGEMTVKSHPAFIKRAGGVGYSSAPADVARQWHPVLRFGGSREWLECNHSQVGWTDLYGTTHPEYFAITKTGRRLINFSHKDRSYICLSNPAVLEQMLKNIEQYDKDQSTAAAFRPGPTPKYVYFGQNDGQTPETTCHCEGCIKYHRPERGYDGYATELNCQFVARYAQAIEKRWPGRKLVAFGYAHYRQPPQEIVIPDNVNLVYVVGNFYYGDKDVYEKEMGMIKGWYEKLGKDRTRLALWMNIVNPSKHDSYVPFMYPDVLKRFLADSSAYAGGYFINGLSPYLRRLGEQGFITAVQSFPMVWLQSRLLWDPGQEPDVLLRQYSQDMFGPGSAADTMFQFYKLVQDRWEYLHQGDLKMSQVEFIHLVRYPDNVMSEFTNLLDKAHGETEEGSMARTRIAYFRDNIYKYFIKEHQTFGAWADKVPAYNCLPVPAPLSENINQVTSLWASVPYITLADRQWGEQSDRKTEIRCLYDDRYLYLQASLYRAKESPWDNEELRMHIALDIGSPSVPHAPNIDRKWEQFKEIRFNSNGVFGVFSCDLDASNIQSEISTNNDCLMIKARIPIGELKQGLADASSMRVQFMRYWGIWNRYDTWSPMLSHISDYPTYRFAVFNFIKDRFEEKKTGLE